MTDSASSQDLMIIDAHCHVWDLALGKHPWLADGVLHPHRYGDYSAVRRTFLPQDYQAAAAPHRIAAAVYMEAEWSPQDPLGETRWIHDLHAKTGFPAAMTGQVWLDHENAADLIAAQAAFPLVRSLRHKPRAFASAGEWHDGHALPGSMRCAQFRKGYALLAQHKLHFELQTPHWHLFDAAELARAFPDTLMIVNHTGVPGARDADTLRRWRAGLEAVAAEPNTRIKIGGLGLPGTEWTVEAQRDVVRTALDLFGAERAMFASNIPVDGLFRPFAGIIDDFLTITADLQEADRRAFFAGTAAQTYGLSLP